MPRYWNKKVLMAKTEATYGTDAAPSGAANAILAQDVQYKPMEGADVSRDLEKPYFGADATIATELMSEITFDVELSPSGVAGTPPAWGALLRACGMAETINAGTSVIYNPITDNPESATIHLYIDGTRFVMLGARGSVRFDIQAQAVPKLRFTFRSLYSGPTEVANPSPDLTPWQNPQVATDLNTSVFQIDGLDLVMRSFVMDLGNQIEGRFLIGGEAVLLTGRSETIETTVEAISLNAFNPYQRALDQSAPSLQLVHGTGAGRIATLDIPAAQMQRPQGLSNAQNIVEWPLRLVPLQVAGNDEFTLTLT